MRPRILITNDDGISSVGLKLLWEAVVPHGQLFIVAPSADQSGTGLGVTFRTPLQIDSVPWDKETSAWKVNGTPADCVKMGFSVLLKEKPDLIVSGVNHGSNAGRTVLYSGTVGGVIEGAFRGVPGIAFSHEALSSSLQIGQYISSIVQHVLHHPLPPGTILNVNMPATPHPKGVRLGRQGKGYWTEQPDARIHPEGSPYFWLGGRWDAHEEHVDSDVSLLKEGFIAAVPIHVNELTDHSFLESRKGHFEKLFS